MSLDLNNILMRLMLIKILILNYKVDSLICGPLVGYLALNCY